MKVEFKVFFYDEHGVTEETYTSFYEAFADFIEYGWVDLYLLIGESKYRYNKAENRWERE